MSGPAKIIEAEAFADDVGGKKSDYSSLPPLAAATALGPPPFMVEVRSPSTLPEGYTFDAVHEGQVFTVTVPTGGVKSGQTFLVPFNPNNDLQAVAVPASATTESTPMLSPQRGQPSHCSSPTKPPPQSVSHSHNSGLYVPTANSMYGVWNSGLCSCFADGCCHASLCNAIFLPQLLIGQVMTRMYKNSSYFWISLTSTIVYAFVRIYLRGCSQDVTKSLEDFFDDDKIMTSTVKETLKEVDEQLKDAADKEGGGKNCSEENSNLLQAIKYVWYWATILVLMKLRRAVRRAYKIPQQCGIVGDCCYSIFCTCCTVSQLARQTADYQRHRAYCCTDTGLAEGVIEAHQGRRQNHDCCHQHNHQHGGHVV